MCVSKRCLVFGLWEKENKNHQIVPQKIKEVKLQALKTSKYRQQGRGKIQVKPLTQILVILEETEMLGLTSDKYPRKLMFACVLSSFSCVHLFAPCGLQPARLLCPWG